MEYATEGTIVSGTWGMFPGDPPQPRLHRNDPPARMYISFLGADGAADNASWPVIPRVGDHVALGVPPGSGISGTVVTVNWQQGSDGDPVVFIEVRE